MGSLLKTGLIAFFAVLFFSCNTYNDTTKKDKKTQELRRKVARAMLTMQRASWEQGVAAQAYLEMGNKEMTYLMAKEAALRQTSDGRLSVVYTDNGNLDPACSGEAVLAAYKESGDPDLKFAADKMLVYLLEKAPKSSEGILYHTLDAPEIWSDAMYMAPPFLAAMGKYNEAFKQIEGFKKYLWNKEKRMFAHRWSDKEKKLVDPHLWGGGNGWAAACYSRVIIAMPDSMKKEKAQLIAYHKELLDACISHMRSDGLFHDFINEPESFVETNLSQMLAYSIFRGIKGGWLGEEYLPAAEKMRKAAHGKVDKNGFVTGACGAPWFNSPGRATEAQAFFLLMEAAYDDMNKK